MHIFLFDIVVVKKVEVASSLIRISMTFNVILCLIYYDTFFPFKPRLDCDFKCSRKHFQITFKYVKSHNILRHEFLVIFE